MTGYTEPWASQLSVSLSTYPDSTSPFALPGAPLTFSIHLGVEFLSVETGVRKKSNKPPRAGGLAITASVVNQIWQGISSPNVEHVRKTGGARKDRREPMMKCRRSLGTGTKCLKRDGLVTNRTSADYRERRERERERGDKTPQKGKNQEEVESGG